MELAGWVESLAADAPSTARISLRPADLGALTVRVEAHAEVLDARFLVETASALAAIERALPELRGVLASAGVALGQASVGWHSGDSGAGGRGNGGERSPTHSENTRAAGSAPAAVGREGTPTRATRRQGLIDVLA
jgi:flagellar hook-length control protein FliK